MSNAPTPVPTTAPAETRCALCGKIYGYHYDGPFCDKDHGHEEDEPRQFTTGAPTPPTHIHEYDYGTPLLGASGQRYVGCACGHRIPATPPTPSGTPFVELLNAFDDAAIAFESRPCVANQEAVDAARAALEDHVASLTTENHDMLKQLAGVFPGSTWADKLAVRHVERGHEFTAPPTPSGIGPLLDVMQKAHLDFMTHIHAGFTQPYLAARAAVEAYVAQLEDSRVAWMEHAERDAQRLTELESAVSRLEGERDRLAQSRNDWRQLASDRRDVLDTLEARVSALTEEARTADVSLAVVWRRDILVGLDAASVNEADRQKYAEGARATCKLFASHAALTEALTVIAGFEYRRATRTYAHCIIERMQKCARAALGSSGGARHG